MSIKVKFVCVFLAIVLMETVRAIPKGRVFRKHHPKSNIHGKKHLKTKIHGKDHHKGKSFSKVDVLDRVSDFNADEHDLIGSSAVLPNGLNKNPMLTLPNGVQVQFGKIVALAGDFYGVPDKPIIDPKADGTQSGEQQKRRQRFLAAYQTLGAQEGKEIGEEVNKLVKMIEEDHVARESGKNLHSHADWDRATGGAWVGGLPIVPGRMLNLATENYDHFQPQAIEAYLVGHQLAIEKAREAARETNAENKKRKLMEAYSMDAFGSHFLTDSFSGGHVRTPRVELHNMTTPSKVGDYLSKFMHDEDCKYGIRVKNKRGDRWITYGDAYLLSKGNRDNVRLANEAVQKSVAQVGEAYNNPSKVINANAVTDIVPFVDPEAVNNFPLFEMRNGELLRRDDVNNLQDRNVQTEWWGTSTVALLQGATKTNSALPLP